MRPDAAIATWGGFAEGDRTIIGVVVVALAVLAVAFVISRIVRRDGRRRRGA